MPSGHIRRSSTHLGPRPRSPLATDARAERTAPPRAQAGWRRPRRPDVGRSSPAPRSRPGHLAPRRPPPLPFLVLRAGRVSWQWRRAVDRSLAGRRRLSFAGQRTGDESTARLVRAAVNLRGLDIYWKCHITDQGLLEVYSAKCVRNLTIRITVGICRDH